jgi:DNA-directed RNA polymerase specialized sigma24 family protein
MAKQPRQRAPEELSREYAFTAELAERRRRLVAAWGDEREASAWGSIATYCRMMANTRRLDAPDSEVAYVPPVEEVVLNIRVLGQVMDRDEEQTSWTSEKQFALNAALMLLSPTERVIAQMFYGGLLEAVEIANAMKTTKGTIEGYLNRIRKKWSRLRNVVG